MGGPGKIAVGAGLAGLMITLAMVSTQHRPPAVTVTLPAMEDAGPGGSHASLARCRTITLPESGCTAAWEAQRRHFFGEDRSQGHTP